MILISAHLLNFFPCSQSTCEAASTVSYQYSSHLETTAG